MDPIRRLCTCNYSHLIFDKHSKNDFGEKSESSTSVAGKTTRSHAEE